MVGYIFCAENTVTKKKYIGKNYSVLFNKKYIGKDSSVLSDAEKYGTDKFIVNMIMACETVKECDFHYDRIIKELNADTDISYYNCKAESETEPEPVAEVVEEKPKKSRKKKVAEE